MTASLAPDDLFCIRILDAFRRQAEGLKKASFKDLSAYELQTAAIQGLSPRHAECMATAWPRELSFDDLVDLRIAGVTEDFVAALRRAGHKDLSPYKALELRRSGVRTSDVRTTAYSERN